MLAFLITTGLGVLWVHYAAQWFGFFPTMFSTILAVTFAHGVATIGFIQVLIRPELFQWANGVGYAAIACAAFFMSFALFLRDRNTRKRPSWRSNFGIAASTVAIASLPSLASSLFSNVEAG